MALLKAVRSQQGAFKMDSFEDGAAYFALAGESASNENLLRHVGALDKEEICDKPSWDDAPEWAQWVAQDAGGNWYWHELKPFYDDDFWVVRNGECDFAKDDKPNPNWKFTLQQRPE
jgi:hypothetical protein